MSKKFGIIPKVGEFLHQFLCVCHLVRFCTGKPDTVFLSLSEYSWIRWLQLRRQHQQAAEASSSRTKFFPPRFWVSTIIDWCP